MTDVGETKSDRTAATGRHDRAARSPGILANRLFGDYELIEELGQGAMGVVYLARQRKADRVVALKVIRPDVLEGVSPDKRQMAIDRFRMEAQSAARLDHENIVTVYEVGEVNGQPFFSMRFVEGESLADILRNGPMQNRRAAIYVESLARALHEAHRHGILHRDIKPQNVMVNTEVDRALLADFGLAKLMEGESELTRDGEVMGTPQYMSPEQATNASTVTAKSDVYSLGATLYHLLTGRPPFQAVTALETLRQVMFQEPRPPREVLTTIDADLETICLKCLEKEPARRYSSAEILADELRRYLNGEPIQARPVGPIGRAWRWCRRNPLMAGLSASAVTCLLVALVATTSAYLRTSKAHAMAEESFRDARGAVNEFFIRVSEDERLKQAGMQNVRKELLEQALQYYMKFLHQCGDDPNLQDEVAVTYYRVGRIVQEVESPEAALGWYKKARDIQQQRIDQEANHFERLESLSDTLNAFGAAYHLMGKLDDAAAAYSQAADLRKQLVQEKPDDVELGRKLANSYMNLGVVAKDRNFPDEARRQLGKAQKLRQQQLELSPDASDVRRDLGMGFYNLAVLDLTTGDDAAAEQNLIHATEAFEQLLASHPQDVNQQYRSAVCYRILADLKAGADVDRAMQLYDKARQRLESITIGVPSYQSALAGVYMNHGGLFQRQQDLAAAEHSLQRAIDVFKPLVANNPDVPQYRRDLSVALRSIAVVQAQRGETDLACNNLKSARITLQELHDQFPDNEDFPSQLATTNALLDQLQCSDAGDEE